MLHYAFCVVVCLLLHRFCQRRASRDDSATRHSRVGPSQALSLWLFSDHCGCCFLVIRVHCCVVGVFSAWRSRCIVQCCVSLSLVDPWLVCFRLDYENPESVMLEYASEALCGDRSERRLGFFCSVIMALPDSLS